MASSSKLSNLQKLLFEHKQTFFNLNDFLDFASDFLEFLSDNKQAVIVSQNENNYNFFQFNKSPNCQIKCNTCNYQLGDEDAKQ